MLVERTRGTPQGGVISPILSNLFLHYAFDLWMTRTHPDLPWCRYADDGLVHCRSELEAETLKVELQARLAECGLEMHPTKTKIVYCKDGKRQGRYPNVTFDFLGYQFRPRDGQKFSEQRIVLQLHPRGQPRGAESHTIDGAGLEYPATDPALAGRHRQDTQSTPSGVDRVLRAIQPRGTGDHAPTRQSDARGHGRCGSSSAFRGARLGLPASLRRWFGPNLPSSNTGVSA